MFKRSFNVPVFQLSDVKCLNSFHKLLSRTVKNTTAMLSLPQDFEKTQAERNYGRAGAEKEHLCSMQLSFKQ